MKGKRISVTISPQASTALDRLLATGLFGRSRGDVAREFIYRGLRKYTGTVFLPHEVTRRTR